MKQDSAIRLQVFLSRNGVCSRREAMEVIKQARVKVNGKVVVEPSTPVTSADKIAVDEREIGTKAFEYILLNKPAGYVTTKEDRFADKTVLDLLPKELQHVHPVGRLDKDTEGLLLLTNDGDLTHALTHPSQEIDKVYFAKVAGRLSPGEKQKVEAGIAIEGKKTAPAKIRDVKFVETSTEFLITIHEGRKRQIRLMLDAVGHRVIYLERIQQGPLTLGGLKRGHWRRLTGEEVSRLKMESRDS